MSSERDAKKLFFLGATGYIGGDALKIILERFPEQEQSVTVLIRDQKKGDAFKAIYPGIRIVYGSLEDTDLLVSESSKADIVMNLAHADHVSGTEAIIAGLKQRVAEGKTSFLIHCSGTGILLYEDMRTETYGESSSKIYDDWEGIKEITSLPDSAPHRDVDKLVLEAGKDAQIKTAIVCPPLIYGIGRGPGNQRSAQIPWLIHHFLKRGKGFQVAEGKAFWNNVHIYDLSELFASLFEEALLGKQNATWGTEAYYFAENGSHIWGDISAQIAQIASSKGLIKDASLDKLSAEDTSEILRYGPAIWGQNSRSNAIRARKLLGWAPKERSLEEDLPTAVDYEVQRLDLT